MTYRCWHCDEEFGAETAAAHFGERAARETGRQASAPACVLLERVRARVTSLLAPREHYPASARGLLEGIRDIIDERAPA